MTITITSVKRIPTRKPRAKKSKLLTPVHLALMDYAEPVRAVDVCRAYQKAAVDRKFIRSGE